MRRAFTVIELIFVIVAIGVLASIALPYFKESYEQSLISKAKSKVTAVRSGIQLYKTKHFIQGQNPLPSSLEKSGSSQLFDAVLPQGVTPGSEAGDWTKENGRYKFILPSGAIIFEYNSTTGAFTCNPNLTSPSSLCNAF